MCVVSMVGDHFKDKWYPEEYKQYPFTIPQKLDGGLPVNRWEFEELKKQVKDLVELLKRAKTYDENNNEPNCEIEEKMDLLKKVAKMVGIDLEQILNK